MKKILVLLSILFVFNGCRAVKTERQVLMLLHYWTGDIAKGINEISEEVNKKQTDIELIPTPLEHEEFKVNIRLLLDSKNPPDLFSYWTGARTKYLVENGQVSPISNIFNTELNREDFGRSVLEACSYNGEIYVLPLTRHFVGFFYNKKLFKDLQIDVPQNWEQFILTAEALKNAEVTPIALGAKNKWPAQFWFDYILLRTAGYDYREDLMNKAAKYTDLEILKTMDLWKNLLDRNYFNENYGLLTWADTADMLIENKAAMTLMGTWIMPYMEEHGMTADDDFGFFPFPVIEEEIEAVSLGPIDGILMAKGSQKKDLSEKILVQLAQPESQKVFNASSGAIAPHLGVSEKIYTPIQLEIKRLIQESPYWAFNYDLATEPRTSEAGLDFFMDFLNSPDAYEELLKEFQKYVSE